MASPFIMRTAVRVFKFLQRGCGRCGAIIKGLVAWLELHGHDSLPGLPGGRPLRITVSPATPEHVCDTHYLNLYPNLKGTRLLTGRVLSFFAAGLRLPLYPLRRWR